MAKVDAMVRLLNNIEVKVIGAAESTHDVDDDSSPEDGDLVDVWISLAVLREIRDDLATLRGKK